MRGQPATALDANDVWEAHVSSAVADATEWAALVHGLDGPECRRLLGRADAARPDDHDARRASVAVFTGLADRLDPADPSDCARIARLIAEGRVGHLTGLMSATEARAADPEVAHCAGLVLAQRDMLAGDLDLAEQRYLTALRVGRERGYGTLTSSAYTAYARFCLDQRRDIEALILARRGSDACAAIGDARGAAYGKLVAAFALESFEDWPRLAEAIEDLRAAMQPTPPMGCSGFAYSIAGLSSDLARGEGRHADAVKHILITERLGSGDPTWSSAEVHLVRAEAAAAGGDTDTALAEIEAGLAAGGRDPLLLALRVCVTARAGHASARAVAEEWLAGLESATNLASGLALRVGQSGGAALRAAGGHDDLAERAYRVAASAALRRLVELERFVTDFPEFTEPTPEEAALVADHRRRIEGREEALRDAVAELLLDEVAAGRRPLASVTADSGVVPCCAWCGRLRNRAGLWNPLPQTLLSLPQDAVLLTHGICPDCLHAVCPDGA